LKKGLVVGIVVLFCGTSIVSAFNEFPSSLLTSSQSSTDSSGLNNSVWPMFCHDVRHTGQSPYGASGNCIYVKWKTELGNSVYFSSPSIASDGTIYIGTFLGELYAINPNGTVKWMFKTADWDAQMTTPAIDNNGIVYVGSYDGNLYAVYPNGTEKWSCYLNWGIISSPAIAQNGVIYIGANKDMCAIDPNGTILWRYTTGDAIKASPAIANNGTIYIVSHDGCIYAFYPLNGTLKWKLNLGGFVYCYSSPAIDDNGTIYYGTKYEFYSINPNGTVKCKYPANWHCYYGGPVISSDGTIYVCGDDWLFAYRANGTRKWVIWMGAYMASPAITKDGMIYAIKGSGGDTRSDTVCLLSPEGSIIFSIKLEDTRFITSSPTIGADGTVYVGADDESNGYLFAIGTKYNEPPNKPTIDGPVSGKIGQSHEYYIVSTDPEWNNIFYFVDWGDNKTTDWIGPIGSGGIVAQSHTWYTKDSYDIKVKAKDEYGMESDWATLAVTMPCSYDIPLFHLWERLLERFPIAFPLLRQLIGY